MEPTVGMRVSGWKDGERIYDGTIYSIDEDGEAVTICRDDGQTGGGMAIENSPYDGDCGWCVRKKIDGSGWGADGVNGELRAITNMKKKIYKIEIEPVKEIKVDDWVYMWEQEPYKYPTNCNPKIGLVSCVIGKTDARLQTRGALGWNISKREDGFWGSNNKNGHISKMPTPKFQIRSAEVKFALKQWEPKMQESVFYIRDYDAAVTKSQIRNIRIASPGFVLASGACGNRTEDGLYRKRSDGDITSANLFVPDAIIENGHLIKSGQIKIFIKRRAVAKSNYLPLMLSIAHNPCLNTLNDVLQLKDKVNITNTKLKIIEEIC